jgi:hypothetical protein
MAYLKGQLGRLGGKPIPRHPLPPSQKPKLRQRLSSRPQVRKLPRVLFCGLMLAAHKKTSRAVIHRVCSTTALGARSKRVKHHAALSYAQIGAFMVALRQHGAIAARALEFLILTATRTGETLGKR